MSELIQTAGRYEFGERIRYSECDHNGRLTLPALIELFQDCSIFHSEAIGFGPSRLKNEHKAWVLTHWHLVVERYPRLNEQVVAGTFASGFKTVSAHRNFYLLDEAGETIAKANSTWGFVDLQAGKPVRPSAEHVAAYGILDPLDMPKEERHVRVPEHLEPCDPIVVHRNLIDMNEHVNNSQYVRLALGVLPAEMEVRQARVDFKRSAVLGDTICPQLAVEPDRTVVALTDEAGTLYGAVELKAAPAEEE